jgi:hypothetical protein
MYTMSMMIVSSSFFLVNTTEQVGHIVNPIDTRQSLNSSYQYLPDSVMTYMAFIIAEQVVVTLKAIKGSNCFR